MGKPSEAILNFENCIRCEETISETYRHIARGWIHFLSERLEDAEQEFELAIEADPACSYAYFSRGYVEDVLKKLDRALVSFDLALKYGPRYSPCGIYNNQAWCYEQKKTDTEKTLKYYTLAIDSNPSFVRAYYNRSKVYQEMGQFDEAITDLEKVLTINRTHLYSYLELGDIYWFDKNLKDKALEYYTYARNVISPTNVYAYLLVASIHAHEKDFELANEELNLGMEKCYQIEFLAELQKKKVYYDRMYLEYLEHQYKQQILIQQQQQQQQQQQHGDLSSSSSPSSTLISAVMVDHTASHGSTIAVTSSARMSVDTIASTTAASTSTATMTTTTTETISTIDGLSRKMSDVRARLERDTYILENKFYENKYRTKMKQRLKALLYIPLSDLEIEATPVTTTRKPTESIFEMSPTRQQLSPMMKPVDFNYYIYYHYEHWNVGSVLFSDVVIVTKR